MPMREFSKAKIHIMDGDRKGSFIEVLFNPSEYSLETANNYRETNTPGLQGPITQFLNGLAGRLTMELYFDTYTDGGGSDVTEKTDQIGDLMGVESHGPPKVEFRWGWLAFSGVVEKVTQRFIMFLPDGTPVRARLSVTFKGVKALSEQLKDPRRNSSDKTKRRTLTADSSIWLIAAKEYGDPRYWRLIARQNRVDDPRAIRPGTALVVPPLDSGRPGGAE
jgi:nucleoid-associated protein YgaU